MCFDIMARRSKYFELSNLILFIGCLYSSTMCIVGFVFVYSSFEFEELNFFFGFGKGRTRITKFVFATLFFSLLLHMTAFS